MAETQQRLLLHPGQVEVWNSPSRFKVIVAGRRWGKTRYALTTIIKEAAIRKRLIWYIAPTYPMAKDIMWPDLCDSIPHNWIKKINETKMVIWLKNGTRIMCKGADDPDTLRGVGLDYVVLDEFQDMHPDTWTKIIRPTLATTGGRATFIGTPKSFNHLYDLFSLGQDPKLIKGRRWQSWQFKTIDSPFVSPEEIEEARHDMDEKSFRQELEASFETMGGRVYYPFDRRLHVSEVAQFNPNLPIWVGQDFNRDPMSAVILQPQPDGMSVHVVDEIVIRNASTEEAVSELERKYWRFQKQTSIYPDPAGSYQQHARGETDLDIFRERGYYAIFHRRKHPKVIDRVNSVNRMLVSADGSVRMKINPKCRSLIASLEQTTFKEATREVDKDMGVEHSADALGYPIEYRFPLKRVKVMGVSI